MREGTVIIFVKAPRAGAVKTRLGATIGMARAAAIFRALMERTIAEAQKGPWRVMLAVDPPSAIRGWGVHWPTDIARVAQGAGDLGARMARAFRKAPDGPVLVVGADAPALRARHLREGFRILRGSDAVFGPAADGGFWLLGVSRRTGWRPAFESVRWSTEFTLEDTLAGLPAHIRVQFLDRLSDIDEAADLAALGPRSYPR